MSTESNVMSWNPALEIGLEPRNYSYYIKDIPLGEYEAILDFKIWAKKAVGISCYFTRVDTGQKFQLTVFRRQDNRQYTLQEVDFRSSPIGVTYKLSVAINSKNNIKLSSAIPK